MGFVKFREPKTETIYLGREFPPGSRRSGWQILWKRLKGGETIKRKKVMSSEANYGYSRSYSNGSALARAAYDPVEYAQNFDQGSGWAEPDNLPRSFSARYANPSSIYRRHLLME